MGAQEAVGEVDEVVQAARDLHRRGGVDDHHDEDDDLHWQVSGRGPQQSEDDDPGASREGDADPAQTGSENDEQEEDEELDENHGRLRCGAWWSGG